MLRLLKNFGHLLEAICASVWYGFPAKQLTIVGVTGTDGKTTTTSLIYHILKQSGVKVAMITSVGAYIGGEVYDIGFHVTTPSSFAIQKYLRRAASQGHTHVVLEITSHALDQNRPWGIHFRVGVLTNISHEHLDYHKSYERYVAAKAKLLLLSDIPILNKEDISYSHLLPYVEGRNVFTYALFDKNATYTPKNLPTQSLLLGDFNARNVLAAGAAALNVGISKEQIKKALLTFTPPSGRQEVVYKGEYTVMVDFAHTPNAFRSILPELRKQTKGKLIHVFGSAGERDRSKRPQMGQISSLFSDIIILTAEDPRSESVESISQAILLGIPELFRRVSQDYIPTKNDNNLVYVIPSREQALKKALDICKKHDTVLCTGKGHETSMNYGSGEVSWSETGVVKKILKDKNLQI